MTIVVHICCVCSSGYVMIRYKIASYLPRDSTHLPLPPYSILAGVVQSMVQSGWVGPFQTNSSSHMVPCKSITNYPKHIHVHMYTYMYAHHTHMYTQLTAPRCLSCVVDVPTLQPAMASFVKQLLPALVRTPIVMGSPTSVTAAPIISTLIKATLLVSQLEGCVQEVWLQIYSGAKHRSAQWI